MSDEQSEDMRRRLLCQQAEDPDPVQEPNPEEHRIMRFRRLLASARAHVDHQRELIEKLQTEATNDALLTISDMVRSVGINYQQSSTRQRESGDEIKALKEECTALNRKLKNLHNSEALSHAPLFDAAASSQDRKLREEVDTLKAQNASLRSIIASGRAELQAVQNARQSQREVIQGDAKGERFPA